MLRLRPLLVACLFVLAAIQGFFSWALRPISPQWQILPAAPSPLLSELLAFGDHQYLFRVLALRLQNAGDFGGRIVPVSQYDPVAVVSWLEAIEGLDGISIFPIALANGFFGQSQNATKIEPIIEYMSRSVDRRPEHKWPWLIQAMSLARYRLNDNEVALRIARQAAAYNFPDIQPWTGLLPAFVLEDMGRFQEAIDVTNSVRARFAGRMSNHDESFIRQYNDFLTGRAAGVVGPRPTWQIVR